MRRDRIAVYPGTFDPVTYGHIDIIKRASEIFDKVVVAVAHNREKLTLFSVEERVAMLKSSIKGIKNVSVDDFSGLVVDYVKSIGANVVIRGLRMISDFEYEFQMAMMNRELKPNLETFFMMTGESYFYLSSHLVKEVVSLGGDVSGLVPKSVLKKLKERFKS